MIGHHTSDGRTLVPGHWQIEVNLGSAFCTSSDQVTKNDQPNPVIADFVDTHGQDELLKIFDAANVNVRVLALFRSCSSILKLMIRR